MDQTEFVSRLTSDSFQAGPGRLVITVEDIYAKASHALDRNGARLLIVALNKFLANSESQAAGTSGACEELKEKFRNAVVAANVLEAAGWVRMGYRWKMPEGEASTREWEAMRYLAAEEGHKVL